MPATMRFDLRPRDGTDYSQTLTPEADAIVSTCYFLALISVILRIYCRRSGGTRLWWDDWCILAAQFWITVSYLVYMISLRNYLGHHIYALGFGAYAPFLATFFTMELLYNINVTLVKASILLFYWRIFAISARKSIIFVGIIVGLWEVATLFVDIFQCWPVSYYWNRLDGTGVCMDPQKFFLGISIPNIVTDFALTVLPLPHVFRLQLRLGQRILLAGIFAIGFFITFVSIIRIVLIMQADLNDPDLTWNLTSATLWSIVEILVGVVCACLPTMRPVIKGIGTIFSGSIHFLSQASKVRSQFSGRRTEKSMGSSTNPGSHPGTRRDPLSSFAQYYTRDNNRNPLELTRFNSSERDLTVIDETESVGAEHSVRENPSRQHSSREHSIREHSGTEHLGMEHSGNEQSGNATAASYTPDLYGHEPVVNARDGINVQNTWTVEYEEV